MFVRGGRLGIRRRSTLTCCRRTRFSASSWALDLKIDARKASINLSKSIIGARSYALCSSRRRRIEFSVHTGCRFGLAAALGGESQQPRRIVDQDLALDLLGRAVAIEQFDQVAVVLHLHVLGDQRMRPVGAP